MWIFNFHVLSVTVVINCTSGSRAVDIKSMTHREICKYYCITEILDFQIILLYCQIAMALGKLSEGMFL